VIADLLTATLAEEIAAAADLRVFVPTTPATEVAAKAAQELGAAGLALARGFTDLDVGQRGSVMDVFTLLRRGRLGVAVAPIQLDAAGRTNLSGIGPVGQPKAAMIGPRGLTENNDTPSPLWYLLAAHSSRALVGRVDMICGPAPSGIGPRVLLTPAGRFELRDGAWVATWLTPGGAELIAGAPEFTIDVPAGTPIRDAADPATVAVLDRVDPSGKRKREFGE
jgi:hypothetical protein